MTRAKFVGSALLLAALATTACGVQAPKQASQTPSHAAITVAVAPAEKANIAETLTFTGDVQSTSQVNVLPKQSGRIEQLNVDVGSKVKAGDVIAQLDHTTLDLNLQNAQAALQAAQAKVATIQAGPKPETVAQAQIAVQIAQSKLQTLLNGPKPENVASAQAAVQSAQAAADAANQKLAALQHPRPDTVAQAQAGLVTAQQTLAALQNPRPEAVAQAQLAVNQAQQKLAVIQAGPRPETVAQANAALAQAQAALQALKNGPSAADLGPLQQAVQIAKNQLNAAQISRDAACNNVNKSIGPGQVGTQAACDAANAQVNAAQSAVDQANATLAKAQQPPSASDLAKAQAAVDQAQAAANLAAHPYTAQDLQQAQDAVKTAEQQLALAKQPGSPQDIAKAQAAVQQAQAALDLARQPGSPQDIAAAADAANQAQAAVTQAEQNLALAQQPYTQEDIDQAKLAVQNAEQALALAKQPYTPQDLQQAQAAVAQAQATVDQAKEAVKETTVTSPVDGVVTQKSLDAGALASPQTSIVTVASDALKITIPVQEAQVGDLKTGEDASITSGALGNTVIPAKVTNIAPSGDAKSRTFNVDITPQQNGALLPGMSVQVGVTVMQHNNVIAVPKDAVVQRDSKPYVFIDENNVAKQAPVTVGLSNGKLTEITNGVPEGAKVVVQGQQDLNDGDPISVAPGQQPAT